MENKQQLPQFGTAEFVTMCESIFSSKPKHERMYSEHEVENIIMKLMSDVHNGDITYGDYVIDFKISPRQWFEQFKKKVNGTN